MIIKNTIVVLSVLLLTVGCLKKEAAVVPGAGGGAAGPVKSLLSNWRYSTTDSINFSFSGGNDNGVLFDTTWTSGLGGARNDCECRTRLTGTELTGTIVLSSCVDFTSRVPTGICNSLQSNFTTGVATYTNSTSSAQLILAPDGGGVYIGALY